MEWLVKLAVGLHKPKELLVVSVILYQTGHWRPRGWCIDL